jgi:hypothetical protein
MAARKSIYKGTDKSTDKAKPVKIKKTDTKPKVYGNSNYNPKTATNNSIQYQTADWTPHLGQGHFVVTKTFKTKRGR